MRAGASFESRTMDLGRCRRAAGGNRGWRRGSRRRRRVESAPLRFTVPPPENGRFCCRPGCRHYSGDFTGRSNARVRGDRRGADAHLDTAVGLRCTRASSRAPKVSSQPPFWSPDSRSLAFFAESKLKRIAIAGGPPQTICDVPAGPGSGSWGSKGDHRVRVWARRCIACPPTAAPSPRSESPITSRDEDGVVLPEFLPDGDRFFYLAGVKNQKGNRVYLGSLSSAGEHVPHRSEFTTGACVARPRDVRP